MESNESTILDSQEFVRQGGWRLFLLIFANLSFGLSSFVISLGLEMNLYLLRVVREREGGGAQMISASFGIKIFIILLALTGIFCGWKYLKSGDTKMKIVNLFGLVLGVFAIMIVLIPFYLYL